jgi:hypothetical protein
MNLIISNNTLLNTNQKESNPFNKLQAAIKTYEQELIQLGYQLVRGGLNYETPWDYWCHPEYLNTVLELDTDSICNEEELIEQVSDELDLEELPDNVFLPVVSTMLPSVSIDEILELRKVRYEQYSHILSK